MRVSVLSLRLATHTAPPPTAIRFGPSPTPITRVTSEPWSMRVTVSSPLFVTQTAPSPTATPAGSRPTLMTRLAPVLTSTRVTVLLWRPITQTAPDPTARSCRPSGIATCARMLRELALTRTAIPGVSRMPTHTPRSPAETATSLALGAPGIAIGAPTRLCERSPMATSVASRWTPTHTRPANADAAAGSGPTNGRNCVRRPVGRRTVRRWLCVRRTHTRPPATTTAFGRPSTFTVRATRPATAASGRLAPVGLVRPVLLVAPPRAPSPPDSATAATTPRASTGSAASAHTRPAPPRRRARPPAAGAHPRRRRGPPPPGGARAAAPGRGGLGEDSRRRVGWGGRPGPRGRGGAGGAAALAPGGGLAAHRR